MATAKINAVGREATGAVFDALRDQWNELVRFDERVVRVEASLRRGDARIMPPKQSPGFPE